jgi:hypothetical protein
MKTIKDPAALHKMALKSGARVKADGGNEFNTASVKAEPAPMMEPEVPYEPPPAPPEPEKPDLGSVHVADKIVDAGARTATMLQEIRDEIKNIQISAAEPITHWIFTFERDDKGYLIRLIADAEPSLKTLN